MDNYLNYHPDQIQDLFCEFCGHKIDEPQIIGEGTEYEKEINLCEKCFNGHISDNEAYLI